MPAVMSVVALGTEDRPYTTFGVLPVFSWFSRRTHHSNEVYFKINDWTAVRFVDSFPTTADSWDPDSWDPTAAVYRLFSVDIIAR